MGGIVISFWVIWITKRCQKYGRALKAPPSCRVNQQGIQGAKGFVQLPQKATIFAIKSVMYTQTY